jgi:hypothetical protein
MKVPVAPVHKYGEPVLWQHYVRATREISTMQSKPEPELVKNRSNHAFRLGVSTANAAHYFASTLRRKHI